MSSAGQLLEAFGFKPLSEGLWWFHRRIEDDGSYEDAIVLARREDDGTWTGLLPYAQDAGAVVRQPHVPARALFHRTTDVRDIVAMAQTEVAASEWNIVGRAPEEGFVDGDEFIICPFHGTWGLVLKTKSEPLSEFYGPLDEDCPDEALTSRAALYRAWRDDFCERLVAGEAPSP